MIQPPGKPGIALYFSTKTTKKDTYGPGILIAWASLLSAVRGAVGRCHHDGGIPYEAHHSRRALALVPVRLLVLDLKKTLKPVKKKKALTK